MTKFCSYRVRVRLRNCLFKMLRGSLRLTRNNTRNIHFNQRILVEQPKISSITAFCPIEQKMPSSIHYKLEMEVPINFPCPRWPYQQHVSKTKADPGPLLPNPCNPPLPCLNSILSVAAGGTDALASGLHMLGRHALGRWGQIPAQSSQLKAWACPIMRSNSWGEALGASALYLKRASLI